MRPIATRQKGISYTSRTIARLVFVGTRIKALVNRRLRQQFNQVRTINGVQRDRAARIVPARTKQSSYVTIQLRLNVCPYLD